MNRWLGLVLRESGICLDRGRLLDWIVRRESLKILAFRYCRLRFSPAILENVRSLNVSSDERGRLFSQAISYLNVGGTYKTTGSARTQLTDAAILEFAEEYEKPRLLEVGVSDGSSAKSLLRAGDIFSEVILTDRHSVFYKKRIPFGAKFLNGDKCLLGIKFLFFYFFVASRLPRDAQGYEVVQTANPLLQEKYGVGEIDKLDIFTGKASGKVHIIKCANILNQSYFSSKEILEAVTNLARSLVEKGILVISQNNEMYSNGEAFFVLRKESGRLTVVKQVNGHPVTNLFPVSISSDDK